jgi:hypothetical protein
MKRIVSLGAVILVITGMAWADPTPSQGSPANFSNTPASFMDDTFDSFYAPETLSTEARYSAGIFGSDIDDFIGVNSYDANIGTFFFLGGYPSDATVDATDTLTNNGAAMQDYAISLGIGKTLNSLYLGLYYGGSLAYASGNSTKTDTYSDSIWRNRVALLVGTSGYGAFRLDMVVDTEKHKYTFEGNITANGYEEMHPPSFALTWGGLSLMGIKPYATIGYLFPIKTISGDSATAPTGKENTTTRGSELGLQVGASYDLNDGSSLSGDVILKGTFGRHVSGSDPQNNEQKWGGDFTAGLKAGYSNTLEFGKVSMGFRPSLALAFKSDNVQSLSGDISIEKDPVTYFEVSTGVDLGVKFQVFETVALYTGAGLRLFDWVTTTDSESDTSAWRFSGIEWSSGKWGPSTNLGLGMTITPTRGLAIGCGLNTLLDKLFVVDLEKMQVRSGSFWGTPTGDFASYFGQIFGNLTFDITVSYKF